MDCTVQSTVKGLKRKEKKNKDIRHGLIFFSCIKNMKKDQDLRVLGLSAKILIIILNLYDPNLSKSGCNTGLKDLQDCVIKV
jgi:hypothetical protein